MSKRSGILAKGVLLTIFASCFTTHLQAECTEETPGNVFCKHGDALVIPGETGRYLPCTYKTVITGTDNPPLSGKKYTCGNGEWLVDRAQKNTYECHRIPLNCPASYER